MKQKPLKLFVVKKLVMASNVEDAMAREKNQKADEVYMDDDWRKAQTEKASETFGFQQNNG